MLAHLTALRALCLGANEASLGPDQSGGAITEGSGGKPATLGHWELVIFCFMALHCPT